MPTSDAVELVPERPANKPVYETDWFRRFPNGGTVYQRAATTHSVNQLDGEVHGW